MLNTISLHDKGPCEDTWSLNFLTKKTTNNSSHMIQIKHDITTNQNGLLHTYINLDIPFY